MTLRKAKLPAIPTYVDLSDLKSNLKFYAEDEIANIKRYLKKNGKYKSYVDAEGMEHSLPFTVFVFNGNYFASYTAKKRVIELTKTGVIKFAQDLETGEWICEKVFKNEDKVNVLQELSQIKAARLAIESEGEAVFLSNADHRSSGSVFEQHGSMFAARKPHPAERMKPKYYLFMRYIDGRNLLQTLLAELKLPEIVKLEMTIRLVEFVIDLHAQNTLHRDLTVKNIMLNPLNKAAASATVIDFGFAGLLDEIWQEDPNICGTKGYIAPEILSEDVISKQYTFASDIFALGCSLIKLWSAEESRVAKEVLMLLKEMCAEHPADRPRLHDVCELLKDIKEGLTEAERCISVFMLDANDYLHAESDNALDDLFYKLKAYDQIRLFSSFDISQDNLLLIRQSLMRNNILVTETVYYGEQSTIQHHFNQRQNQLVKSGRIYKFSFNHHAVQINPNFEYVINMSDLPHDNIDIEEYFDEQVECLALPQCFGWLSSTFCEPLEFNNDDMIELETPNGVVDIAFPRSQIGF